MQVSGLAVSDVLVADEVFSKLLIEPLQVRAQRLGNLDGARQHRIPYSRSFPLVKPSDRSLCPVAQPNGQTMPEPRRPNCDRVDGPDRNLGWPLAYESLNAKCIGIKRHAPGTQGEQTMKPGALRHNMVAWFHSILSHLLCDPSLSPLGCNSGVLSQLLRQQPPREQTDDHEQHEDRHAGDVEHHRRRPVLGDLLLVRPLKLIVGQPAVG